MGLLSVRWVSILSSFSISLQHDDIEQKTGGEGGRTTSFTVRIVMRTRVYLGKGEGR